VTLPFFYVRGPQFFQDNEKIQHEGDAICRLVHLDLLKARTPEEHVFPKRRDSIPRYFGLPNEEREFYLIFNFTVCGKDNSEKKSGKKLKGDVWFHWIFYFALPKGARKDPKNKKFFLSYDAFLNGDDRERNHRGKFILCVAEGPWIVKAAIGGKDGSHKGVTPTLIGEKVTTTYYKGEDYLEVDYNTAIDNVAVTSSKLAFQHSQKLVVDVAVVLQGETEDELPEKILGSVRCSNFIISEADLFPGTVIEKKKK